MVMAKRDFPGGIKFPPKPMPMPLPGPLPGKTNPVDQAVFDLLDGDGNGKISGDEWKASHWTPERQQLFDADGDGQVSRREFTEARRLEREFNAKDRNGDGKLERKEFAPIFRKLPANPLWAKAGELKDSLKDKLAEAVGGAAEAAKHLSPLRPYKDRFATMDENRDGAVSKEEYFAARRQEQQPILKPWQPIHRVEPGESPLIEAKPLRLDPDQLKDIKGL